MEPVRKFILATIGTVLVTGTFIFVSVPYTLGYLPGSQPATAATA